MLCLDVMRRAYVYSIILCNIAMGVLVSGDLRDLPKADVFSLGLVPCPISVRFDSVGTL